MSEDDFTGYGPDDSRTPARHGAEDSRHRHPHNRHPERNGPARSPRGPTHAERMVALVDARFWAWMNDDDAAMPRGAEGAQEALQQWAHQHGIRLMRTVWYSDQDSGRSAPGLQARRVPSNAQDRGVAMLRAMAQDLVATAEHRAVDRVLLVSDDDRLLLAVDEAQRRGLMVDMLVDAESQDLKALQDDEPNWASLLQLADRLVVLGGTDLVARSQRPRSGQPDSRMRHEPPSAEASGIIEDEILTWWDDETPDQRDHWRQEVQASRGIPQELDRQLLLRISRRLGQALSPAEKSAMRQQVRQQVMGGSGNEMAGAGPATMSTDA